MQDAVIMIDQLHTTHLSMNIVQTILLQLFCGVLFGADPGPVPEPVPDLRNWAHAGGQVVQHGEMLEHAEVEVCHGCSNADSQLRRGHQLR